jgi:T5orf172 domain
MAYSNLREELEEFIGADDLQVGQTFRAVKSGVSSNKELVEMGLGANSGVVGINKQIIRAILEGEIPNSGNISRYAYRVIKRLKANTQNRSDQLNVYLDELQEQLAARSKSTEGAVHDVEQILESSEKLARKASEITNAVYVYSFPTYLHYGTIEDPDYKWFKIGSTRNTVWQRIVDQSRQTSMPEDPVLIRIYHSESKPIAEIEAKFHKTLERVGHERSSASRTRAGKEWFATTEDALDAIAELMELTIESDFQF